jgi:hypothetical protein
MKLVQIFLPRHADNGRRFPAALYARERELLVERFGELTAFTRSPVRGLWRSDAQAPKGDDLVIFELMVRRLDRQWWNNYRYKLQKRFRQKSIRVRVQDAKLI